MSSELGRSIDVDAQDPGVVQVLDFVASTALYRMFLAAVCAPQEELREGSGAFLVHAYLPVEASFGLADEMRRRSSGAASASLLLSHWERLQVGWMN
jgi:hypothetical protein